MQTADCRLGLKCRLRYKIEKKTLNNNDHNLVFLARETEHPQQTIVLTKTAGHQPGSGHCCQRSWYKIGLDPGLSLSLHFRPSLQSAFFADRFLKGALKI